MSTVKDYIKKSRVIQSDSLDFMKTIESNSIDLIITSPPYNVGKEYEIKTDLDKYLKKQEEFIIEIYRILSPTGNVAWQVGNYINKKEVFPLDIYFYPLFKKLGFQLRNRIIWRFGHGLHAKTRFSGRYETILWFSKTDQYTFNLDDVRIPSKYPGKKHYKGEKKGTLSGNPKGKNPEDVWDIVVNDWEEEVWNIVNVKSNHVEKTEHPAQFPIELVDRLVLALSNENDIVLDPFGGSGSTIIGAVKNNRIGISIELSEKYIDITNMRLKMLEEGSLPMRKMTKPIHKPIQDSLTKIPKEWLGKGAYKDEN